MNSFVCIQTRVSKKYLMFFDKLQFCPWNIDPEKQIHFITQLNQCIDGKKLEQ